jgi:hypothetical protein
VFDAGDGNAVGHVRCFQRPPVRGRLHLCELRSLPFCTVKS